MKMINSPYSSAVVLLSGGADSTTLLHELVDLDVSCIALSFDYRQTHRKELRYAADTTKSLGVEFHLIDVGPVFRGSALTGDKKMPEGHYTDSGMRDTVVPNRNMVFISLGISVAIQRGFECIAISVHADDYGTYPDCRSPFIDAMCAAAAVCDYKPIRLWTPYLHYTKKQIISRGLAIGVDYSKTWSCYKGGEVPCGVCGSCSARNESMKGIE
jgi:7-cyano-7-deazaguanine synthase